MNSRKINKILIANRGEIAVRIMKTLKKLHIVSVAVFAENDANALHRRMADEAYPLGNGSLKDTYLNIQKIIDAALDSGADAIHPGYGFLSENPEFAEACQQNNLIFIGPDAETMRLMGNKIAARQVAIDNGIPVTFGLTGDLCQIMAQADTLPYPVLIKAAAGGGGATGAESGRHSRTNAVELPIVTVCPAMSVLRSDAASGAESTSVTREDRLSMATPPKRAQFIDLPLSSV